MDEVTVTTLARGQFLAGSAATLLACGLTPAKAATEDNPLVYIGLDKWLFARWESLTDAGLPAIEPTLALVAQTSAWFAQKGVGFFLYVVPIKARYYPSKLPPGTTIAPEVVSRYARVMQMLAQLGIKTVDVDAAITPVAGVAGQEVFYHTDQHWTTWSAEATGAAVASSLLASWPELAGGSTPSPLGPWYSYQKQGDLAVLCSPQIQAQLGEETFVSRHFSDYQNQDGSGNYALPVAPDVHIVGNSLSNPYCGLPEKLANELSRPIGLTWLYGNVGPWHTMLDYVESGKFSTPPKVLIWQMNEPTLINGPYSPGFWDKSAQISASDWSARMKTGLGL